MDDIELQKKMLGCVQAAEAAIEKAAAERKAYQEKRAAAEARLPGVLDKLILHRRIDPADREKAAAKCLDPVGVLEILELAADPAVTIDPPQAGTPVKAAGQNGHAGGQNGRNGWQSHPNYVGARRPEKSAADHAYEARLRGE